MPIRASTSVSGGCSWVGPLGPAFGRPDGKLSETIVGLAVGKGLMGSLRPTHPTRPYSNTMPPRRAERPIEGPDHRAGSDWVAVIRRKRSVDIPDPRPPGSPLHHPASLAMPIVT